MINKAWQTQKDDRVRGKDGKPYNPKRILVYRFLELSFITRTGILSELGLINEEDEGIEHVELLDRIFHEAQEKNVLDQLWDKVNYAHNDDA